jgi:hypothetical protein
MHAEATYSDNVPGADAHHGEDASHDALRCRLCARYLWHRWAAIARRRYRFGGQAALRLAFARWLRQTGRLGS